MDFEEHTELLRKKRGGRKLIDIDIDEISIVSSPAVRKSFYIQKRSEKMKGFDDILGLAGEFMSEDVEKAKGVDARKLMQAVQAIIDFKEDLPDKLKNAISVILKWAAGKGYGYPTKKGQVDNFPSIPIMVPASTIENMLDEDDEDVDE